MSLIFCSKLYHNISFYRMGSQYISHRASSQRIFSSTSHGTELGGRNTKHSAKRERSSMLYRLSLKAWHPGSANGTNIDISSNNEEDNARFNTSKSPIVVDRTPRMLPIIRAFLPVNYPDQIPPSYKHFATWQFIQHILSTLTSMLAMQALLMSALGSHVSQSTVLPMAAVVNWMLKDGIGQLGGVLFSSRVNIQFDSDAKRFRFWSLAAIQVACGIDLLTCWFPQAFLVLASVSNVFKNIAWLALGAARAPINQTFATKDNLGDITVKFGSQTTLASIIGTFSGIAFSAYIIQSDLRKMALAFGIIVLCDIFAMYKANCCVSLDNFNPQRLDLIMSTICGTLRSGKMVSDLEIKFPREEKAIVKKEEKNVSMMNAIDSIVEKSSVVVIDDIQKDAPQAEAKLPSPDDISLLESFIFGRKKVFSVPLHVHPNPTVLTDHLNDVVVKALENGYSDNRYVLIPKWTYNGCCVPKKVELILYTCDPDDSSVVLQGYIHACIVRYMFEHGPIQRGSKFDENRMNNILEETKDLMSTITTSLLRQLKQSGWRLEHPHIVPKRAYMIQLNNSRNEQ